MRKFLLLAPLGALLAGCIALGTRTHGVHVSAINDREVEPPKRYSLKSAPSIPADTLEFKELRGLIHGSLARQGFIHVTDDQAADSIITVDYFVGPKHTRSETRTERTYAKIEGGQSQTVAQTATGDGSQTKTTQTTTKQPDVVKPIEERTYQIETTTYPVHLTVSARLSGNGGSTAEIWKTSAAIQTSNPDLRAIFPILVTAMESYLGGNSGREITVDVLEKDGRLWTRQTP